MAAMHAAQALLKWPSFLQRLANLLLPQCIGQRAMLKSIKAILGPEIKQREQERALMQDEKGQMAPGKDTMDWMSEIARGRPFDLVSGQLQLNFVAIHTTSTLMSDVLLDLCAFPEYIPKLREEICRVLSENGWKKTAMYKLKRMDSFVKESLRLRPQSMSTPFPSPALKIAYFQTCLFFRSAFLFFLCFSMWNIHLLTTRQSRLGGRRQRR